MYRTRITLTVLSEDPIPESMEIGHVMEECDTGAFVLAAVDASKEALSDAEMVTALEAAGSDAEFFFPERGER